MKNGLFSASICTRELRKGLDLRVNLTGLKYNYDEFWYIDR